MENIHEKFNKINASEHLENLIIITDETIDEL